MRHPPCPSRRAGLARGEPVIVANNGRPAKVLYQFRSKPGWYRIIYTDAAGGSAQRPEHQLERPAPSRERDQ